MSVVSENSMFCGDPAAAEACSARSPLRLGVVGARARRQGIGEHVARHFAGLGHDVVAIAGSSLESAAAAQRHLQQSYGLATRAYADVETLLRQESLDAVAICSPDPFHRQQVQAAIERGVHVLCEKPLVFEPGRDPARDALALVEASRRANTLLMVNEQWPYTLPTFAALHPEADLFGAPPRRIAMRLSPSVTGVDMIPNAVPHLLSLVWRLCPAGGDVGPIDLCGDRLRGTAVDIAFEYRYGGGATQVLLKLRQTPAQPRPAAYAIDQRGARRIVEMSPYRFVLEAADESQWDQPNPSAPSENGAQLPLPDPLATLAADFTQRVEQCRTGGACWRDDTLVERQHALGLIAAAAEQYFAS